MVRSADPFPAYIPCPRIPWDLGKLGKTMGRIYETIYYFIWLAIGEVRVDHRDHRDLLFVNLEQARKDIHWAPGPRTSSFRSEIHESDLGSSYGVDFASFFLFPSLPAFARVPCSIVDATRTALVVTPLRRVTSDLWIIFICYCHPVLFPFSL